jgi:hypothetical protein
MIGADAAGREAGLGSNDHGFLGLIRAQGSRLAKRPA